MDRTTPVRKPHTSTADLLTWPEVPAADSPALPSSATRSAPRSHQPSDGISKVVFGGQVTDEEVETLNKRKPCSGYKMKEMTGSGIFVANEGDDELESGSANPAQNKTGIRMYQQAMAGISHISFGEEGSVSPKKPTTVPEVAKQRELSGNLESDSDAKLKKQLSDAKCKELSGHDIFAAPPEILPRPTTARTLDLKGSIEIGEPILLRNHILWCEVPCHAIACFGLFVRRPSGSMNKRVDRARNFLQRAKFYILAFYTGSTLTLYETKRVEEY